MLLCWSEREPRSLITTGSGKCLRHQLMGTVLSSLPDLTAQPGLGTVHSWAVPQTVPSLPQDNQLYQTSTSSLLPFCLCWCPSAGAHGLGVCRNHSWMMNPSPWTARPAGCSIKCSCLVSSNCTYKDSAQVLFKAHWIAFTHLLSRTLQVWIRKDYEHYHGLWQLCLSSSD